MQVGDYVLYKDTGRVEAGESRGHRLWREDIYQVVHAPFNGDDRVLVIADAITGRTDNLGFRQQVSADKLTLVEMLPVSRSHEHKTKILFRGQKTGTVEGQRLDGRVYIRIGGQPRAELVDLSCEVYQWMS